MAKAILLLINPISGKGNNIAIAEQIAEKLLKDNWLITKYISTQKGDFSRYVQAEKLDVFTHIGIVGGDGTLHEVINGLMTKANFTAPPILLFPCGSGNSLNHDLACFTIKTALQRLEVGKTNQIDLIKIKANNQIMFGFNIVGFGVVNEINVLAEKWRWLGGLRYSVASIFGILKNPSYAAEVIIDGQKYDGPFSFVLISNTIHTGKAMRMSPLAQLSDGLLDIIVVKHLSIWQLLILFPKIFTGTHVHSPLLKYIHAKSVIIKPEIAQIGNIDGEVKGISPFEITVLPKMVEIIC